MAAAPRTASDAPAPPAPAETGMEALLARLAALEEQNKALAAKANQPVVHIVKDTADRVTDATAERQFVAAQIEKRNAAPLNVAIREGGYFLSSAGIPTDCEGKRIPEAEWLDADFLRLKGMSRAEAVAQAAIEPTLPHAKREDAPTEKHGADVVDTSGSELRRPQPPRR